MDLQQIAGAHGLTGIDVSYTQVTARGLSALGLATKLETLRLRNLNLSDESINELCPFENVRALDISGNRLSARGICRLSDLMPKVERLTFTNCSLSADGARAIREGWPDLTNLDLTGSTFNGNVLGYLNGLRNLTALELGSCGIHDRDLLALNGLKRLKMINLSWNEVSDFGISRLRLVDVEELGLVATQVQGRSLQGCQHLDRLMLGGTEVNDGSCLVLADLKSLRRLRLQSDRVTVIGVKKLENLRLTSLTLIDTPLTDEAISHLWKIETLERLVLWDVGAAGENFEGIERLTNLRWLELRRVPVNDAVVAQLARCPSIESLYLDSPRVTDASLPQLLKFERLSTLRLGISELSPAAIAKLKGERKGVRVIKE
jgi:Leucine-rich repeat (LRR) protein